MRFQNNNDKKHCLRLMPKVSNETKFKRKAFGDFLCHKKTTFLCKEDRETFFDIIFYIFMVAKKCHRDFQNKARINN